jgi:hypothetical protein
MIQDAFDGKKRIIDLAGSFAVRCLENCRPSRVDRSSDRFEYQHTGMRFKPLFSPVFLQHIIH